MSVRNVLSIFVLVSLSSSAFAADSITCTLTSVADAKQTTKLELALSSAGAGGEESEGSVDVGDSNYNFSMDLEANGSKFDLTAIFYENNHVVDEVGSMSCEFDPSVTEGEFCQEPMEDDNGEHIMDFACRAN